MRTTYKFYNKIDNSNFYRQFLPPRSNVSRISRFLFCPLIFNYANHFGKLKSGFASGKYTRTESGFAKVIRAVKIATFSNCFFVI